MAAILSENRPDFAVHTTKDMTCSGGSYSKGLSGLLFRPPSCKSPKRALDSSKLAAKMVAAIALPRLSVEVESLSKPSDECSDSGWELCTCHRIPNQHIPCTK